MLNSYKSYEFNKKTALMQFILAVVLLFSTQGLYGQYFTKVTDGSNPVVTDAGPTGYSGASWIDIDSDGDLDLFINNSFLYLNDGSGTFSRLSSTLGSGQPLATGNGQTWGDYDNDGNVDVYIASLPSKLYHSNGDNTFNSMATGDIGDSFGNRGWSPSWADFNNDGFLDLFITHPTGFVGGGPSTNHFLINQRDGRFTKADTGAAVNEFSSYTVATWSDYDNDGDMDLFIGSGPANGSVAPDDLFQNMLTETGVAFLKRIDTDPIATTLHDGQVWNWIDYDNDGDLDVYVTNWGGGIGGIANKLYRNDGVSFVEITTGSIVTDVAPSLSSVWGDFDNDGDLDVFVANDNDQKDKYYSNNGDGTFTSKDTVAVTESVTHRGASAGDYDNDGDLDLISIGPESAKSLFRNDTENGNNWINITSIGSISNKSAIGAKVRVKANIFGTTVWQMREISAQNNFAGMNSLRSHFGLGDATVVDSLIVEWPSGGNSYMTDLTVNQFLIVTEEIPEGFLRANSRADTLFGFSSLTVNFTDLSLSDPLTPITTWEWDFDNDGTVDSEVQNPTWTYSGMGDFTVKLTVTNDSTTKTIIRENYIKLQGAVSVILVNTQQIIFGLIDINTPSVDTTYMLYNVGDALDTIRVKLDTSSISPASGVTVIPELFTVAAGDSQAITFSFTPSSFETGKVHTTKIIIDSEKGFPENHFERVVKFAVTGIISAKDEEVALPEEYNLRQNYPNPFNPLTSIDYTLPLSGAVTLKVYNLRGDLVTELVNKHQNAGNYSVKWDASTAASGLYFYKLTSGHFSKTMKMMLLK